MSNDKLIKDIKQKVKTDKNFEKELISIVSTHSILEVSKLVIIANSIMTFLNFKLNKDEEDEDYILVAYSKLIDHISKIIGHNFIYRDKYRCQEAANAIQRILDVVGKEKYKAIKDYVFKKYPDLKHCDLEELICDLKRHLF